MGKKKKKDKKKKNIKNERYSGLSKKEETIKSLGTIKVPEDADEFKLDNDNKIDKFLRFNRRNPIKLSPKVEKRQEKIMKGRVSQKRY